jgi:hypothetical protein
MGSHKVQNIRGLISERLVAVSPLGKIKDAHMWRCYCKCGKFTTARTTQIIKKTKKSCGCLTKDILSKRNFIHGHGRTPTHAIWSAMVNRCYNEGCKEFKWYGGKGIWVCDRWRNAYLEFLNDMGAHPSGTHCDRLDNKSGYCCGKCDDCINRGILKCNCAWRTVKENQRNRSNNVLLTHNGSSKTIAEWAEITGFKYDLLWERHKRGWTPAEALTIPVNQRRKPKNAT